MALISLQEVSLGFGGPLLLDEVNLQIERGEMVGLLGRNGMGKSTLLKLIYGDLNPESGSLARQQNLRIAYLPQDVPLGLSGSVAEIVAGGLDPIPAKSSAPDDAWQRQLQVEKVISRMQLDPAAQFDTLSAGMKRRVLLARGLVRSPTCCCWTNRPTTWILTPSTGWKIFWHAGAVRCCLSPMTGFSCNTWPRASSSWTAGACLIGTATTPPSSSAKKPCSPPKQEQNTLFDKKLAQEEQWIRRGIEARRTRNEGRVRALKRLRDIRRERREQPGKVRMQIQEDRRSGRLVIEAENIRYSFENQPIRARFFNHHPARRQSRHHRAQRLRQNHPAAHPDGRAAPAKWRSETWEPTWKSPISTSCRSQLDENHSLLDNVGQGRDTITINGRTRNLVGYLEDFLFSRDRVHAPISALSGGERNRLLLARLFARPANLLVMDEPTNDLDIETLELLEDLLLEYNGTLLLVSHDRAFLNNLVTSTLVMDGSGDVNEYVGGYDDWIRQTREEAAAQPDERQRKTTVPARSPDPQSASDSPRKLSYKEQRALEAQKQELAELPQRIEALEAEQHQLNITMADPAFYQQDNAEITRAANRVNQLAEELAQAYHRWEELETILSSS